MHWLVKVLIAIGIIVLVILAFGALQLVGNVAKEQSREDYCRETRANCYTYCDEKLIDYFCNKECDENYKVCIS